MCVVLFNLFDVIYVMGFLSIVLIVCFILLLSLKLLDEKNLILLL